MSEQQAFARDPAARDAARRRPIHVRAGATELAVDPTALNLHVDAAASVRAAREAGRSRNPVNQLTGTVLRRFRSDHIPFVVDVDPGRFDAVLDAWVAQTGKGLVDGGLPLRRHPGDRDPPEVRHRDPAGRGEGIRSSTRCGQGESDAGSLTIGPTTPAVDARGCRPRAAALARAVLARAGHRHGERDAHSCSHPSRSRRRCRPRSSKSKLVLQVGPDQAPRRVRQPARRRSRPRPRTRGSRSTAPRSPSSRRSRGSSSTWTSSSQQIARGSHTFVANVGDVQPARHHGVGAEAQHHRARLELHDVLHAGPAAGDEHPPRRRHDQRHDRPARRDVLVERRAGTAHRREGLRPRTPDRGRPRGRGRDRRWGEPGLDHALQRDVLRLLPGRDPHRALALPLPLPDGARGDAAVPLDRQPVEERLRVRRADPRVLQLGTRSRSRYYGNKAGRSCRAEGPHILQTIPPETEYVDDPSLPAGQTKTLESGQHGYVVENFRIISTPGQPDKRERYVEHYSMTKNKIARGTGGAPSRRPHPRPRRRRPPRPRRPTGLGTKRERAAGRNRAACSTRLVPLSRIAASPFGPAGMSDSMIEARRFTAESRRASPSTSTGSARLAGRRHAARRRRVNFARGRADAAREGSSRSTRSRSTTSAAPTSAPSSSATATTGTSPCTRPRRKGDEHRREGVDVVFGQDWLLSVSRARRGRDPIDFLTRSSAASSAVRLECETTTSAVRSGRCST